MKCKIEMKKAFDIAFPRKRRHAIEGVGQIADLLAGRQFQPKPPREPLQMKPQCVEVVDFRNLDGRDLYHLVAREENEPFAREAKQRFAQRCAAVADFFSKKTIVDHRAGLKLTAKDHRANCVISLCGLRLSLALGLG